MTVDDRSLSREQSAALDLGAIRSLLAASDVRYAIVFGSFARENATASSDIDLALRFTDELSRRERFDRRNHVDSTVQRYAERFVDVSDLTALPDEVALNALRDGVVIYGDETAKTIDERRLARRVSGSQRAQERRAFIDRLAEGNV